MTASSFLLVNLALAFYNVSTICTHEIDIFRTSALEDRNASRPMHARLDTRIVTMADSSSEALFCSESSTRESRVSIRYAFGSDD